MIVLIDNYDSFSYNLYQGLGAINPDIRVIRNDAYTVDEIAAMDPSHIVMSPGPGRPADAGVCEQVALELGARIPLLGVCLGHQAICEAYGAKVDYAKQLMHGKQSPAVLDKSCPLFAGLSECINVARYHSLAVVPETLPHALRIVARTDDGEIMAVQHTEYPIFGLQFHPESILTPTGMDILANFLKEGERA